MGLSLIFLLSNSYYLRRRWSRQYSNHTRLCLCVYSMCLCVFFPHGKTKTAENKKSQTWHSPSRFLAHQWMLDQKVKGQGHRITKSITSRWQSATPSRCGCLVAQRDGPARPSRRLTEGDRVVGISHVAYSVECPASKFIYVCRFLRLTSSVALYKCITNFTNL